MAVSNAVDVSAVARVVGIETIFQDLRGGRVTNLPQRIAVIGQGNTASTYTTVKRQVSSAGEVATVYGFGSPLHLAVAELLPFNGDGVGSVPVTVYPLQDAGGGVASTGMITVDGTATGAGAFTVVINGARLATAAVAMGDTASAVATALQTAIDASLNSPVTAAASAEVVTVTSKWDGPTANDIRLSVDGPGNLGLTFAIVQPAGGATNPDVNTALNQIGGVWETLIVNCLGMDTTVLNAISEFNEGRWRPLVRRPLIAFAGSNTADVATATTVTDARPADRTNCQLVAPGSPEFPMIIAARQVARIAVLANNNPPRDYGSTRVQGLIPGTDQQQWNYLQRDRAVKAGSSTIEVRDGLVTLSDVVTMWHPMNEAVPAYRFVVDIIKLQNIIFNVDLIFNTPAWDGAPLIPNDQPTTNRQARKPKDAIAAINALIDNLGLEAIISDPETAKASTQAIISTSNPKRLELRTTLQVSGNDNITSIDLEWGFFFGTAPIV